MRALIARALVGLIGNGSTSGMTYSDGEGRLSVPTAADGRAALAACADNDSRLSNARTPTAHGHAQSDVTNLTSDLAGKAAVSHTHNASDINAGTVATARLGGGTANSSTFLRGDQTYAAPPGGNPYTTSRVTGSNATTTGQSLVDITGLSIALLANTVYEFEAVLSVQSSSTAGNGYGIQFSAAGATIEAQATGTLAAATQKTARINAFNTAATPFVTVAATGGIIIKGVIAVGANAGTLSARHLKVTSGTSTVFINSFVKVRAI